MKIEDYYLPGEHEMLIAAVEVTAAEVFAPQITALEPGAGGSIQTENPLVEEVFQLGKSVCHGLPSVDG